MVNCSPRSLLFWLWVPRRSFPIADCVCVLRCVGKGVGKYSQHNLHHTNHIWIYNQHIVDLLTVVCSLDVVGNFLARKHGRRWLLIFFPRWDSCLWAIHFTMEDLQTTTNYLSSEFFFLYFNAIYLFFILITSTAQRTFH